MGNTISEEVWAERGARVIERSRVRQFKRRLQVREMYGTECKDCGLTQNLQLATGNTVPPGITGTYKIYWLADHDYPAGPVVLCRSCNTLRRIQRGRVRRADAKSTGSDVS